MALSYHFGCGFCSDDPMTYTLDTNFTLERTCVSAANAGWLKHSGTSLATAFIPFSVSDVSVPAYDTASYVWDTFYYYGRNVSSGAGTPNTTYKGVWYHPFLYPVGTSGGNYFARAHLRFINDGTNHRFELVEIDTDAAGTTSLGRSAAYAGSVARTITTRIDYTNAIIKVFVDRTLEITGTLVMPSHTGTTWYPFEYGIGDDANRRSFYIAPSSESVDGYWSSLGRFSSTTAGDFVESGTAGFFPEVLGHSPNSDTGITYDQYWSESSSTPGAASYTQWDDLTSSGVNDGTTTWNGIGTAGGTQTSKISSQTYSNTVRGAQTYQIYGASHSNKGNLVHSALIRFSGTNKTINLSGPPGTAFDGYSSDLNSLPGGAAWTNLNSIEYGNTRAFGTAQTNLQITAIWLEGFALGTTVKKPANPPAPVVGSAVGWKSLLGVGQT